MEDFEAVLAIMTPEEFEAFWQWVMSEDET